MKIENSLEEGAFLKVLSNKPFRILSKFNLSDVFSINFLDLNPEFYKYTMNIVQQSKEIIVNFKFTSSLFVTLEVILNIQDAIIDLDSQIYSY